MFSCCGRRPGTSHYDQRSWRPDKRPSLGASTAYVIVFITKNARPSQRADKRSKARFGSRKSPKSRNLHVISVICPRNCVNLGFYGPDEINFSRTGCPKDSYLISVGSPVSRAAAMCRKPRLAVRRNFPRCSFGRPYWWRCSQARQSASLARTGRPRGSGASTA